MSDERKPVANITPFGLRMQPELKTRVESAARENNRSLNAEIVARLELSFEGTNAALIEAAKVAESLRASLTERIETYDAQIRTERERELALQKELIETRKMRRNLERDIEAQLKEQRKEMEEEHQLKLAEVRQMWQRAHEYGQFTIAREKQFVETIKALTGKEPPAVEPAPSKALKRSRERKVD